MRRRLPLELPLLGLAASCGAPDSGAVGNRAATETATLATADLLATNLDPSVDPGVDFFQYANGGWMKRNPIPPSEAAWTIGHLVNEELYAIKRTLNEQATRANGAPGSDEQKLGDFWSVAMDETRINAEGAAPLAALFAKIDALRDATGVVTLANELQQIGVEAFWSLGISQDAKQSDVIAVQLSQGGLGLPERDYYFNDEPGVAAVRAEYPHHVARLLTLLGRPAAEAESAGAAILAFETALAQASKPLEALRDPYANYHKMSVELFREYAPHCDWRALLDVHGLAAADSVIVGQPEFFVAVDALLQATPLALLQDYLRVHLLHEFAAYLSRDFDVEHFAFYGRTLQGAKEQRPRWKRVLDAQERAMGMVVGRLFVRDYFSARTKQRYVDLVESIRATYREHLLHLDWMSQATKEKALAKLDTMKKKVGYPDRWKDCTKLVVGRESFAQNMMNAARFEFGRDVAKFGKPVDRDEWEMTPQTYNAYYNPSNNEIVLPAGIFLIPGLRDEDADDALVYGYAGASTIGHEITHGFDDEGRQFDIAGNLADWWTAEDAAQFNARAQVMVKQFAAYEPLPGLFINGEATLGENIADFGGVVLGLDAFKKTAQYREGKSIAGLTPVQRYFLGYALGWLGHQRDERLRQQLLSDVHSPAKWRVNGPFANVPQFHQAFAVAPGAPMWRDEKEQVKIW